MAGYLRAQRARSMARTKRVAAVCVAVLAMLAGNQLVSGQTVGAADSTPQSQQQAVAAVPLDQLTEEAQAKLWPVLSDPSIYRRLPTELINCDRDMYLTLVRHPEIIVSIWHLMDVTDLTIKRSGPFSFDCDDKAGTTSQVELIYGTANTHVFYADTLYEGSMFARPVKGRLVLLLRSEYLSDEQGRPQVKTVMDAFIRIDHLTAKLIARTMAPLVVRTADHNFVESFRFVSRVNDSAEENGPGMRELAERLEGVDRATAQQFANVSTLVSQRADARRELAVAAAQRAATQLAAPAQSEPVASQPVVQQPLESANALERREIQLRR